jgi:hypothetical protein
MYMDSVVSPLVGKKILRIFVDQDHLRFQTDHGVITYEVSGDCCSQSVFYDFIGVRKLLDNGPVISAKEIELKETDIEKSKETFCDEKDENGDHECIQVYGFEIVTEDPKFGEVTSVFSFRNYSNGYYGGDMSKSSFTGEIPELTEDTTHIKEKV